MNNLRKSLGLTDNGHVDPMRMDTHLMLERIKAQVENVMASEADEGRAIWHIGNALCCVIAILIHDRQNT